MVSDPNNSSVLWIANFISSTLSLFGSLFMSYFCVKSQALQTASGKLIFAIAFSDLFYSIANLMSVFKNDIMDFRCYTEGFIRVWSLELNLFFPSCIAILCYKATDLSGTSFNQDKFARTWIPAGIMISLLMALGPLFLEHLSYTNGQAMCFTKITVEREVNPFMRVGLFLVYGGLPIVSALVITITCYILTIIKLRQISQLVMDKIDTSRLLWYPAVLFITFVPCMLIDIGLTFYGTKIKFLEVFSLVITHSMGFSNALVYGVQRKFYHSEKSIKDENLKEYWLAKSGSFNNSTNAELVRAHAGTFGDFDHEDKLYFD